MKMNWLEFTLINSPLRAALQRRIETSLLLGTNGMLTGRRVLEVGCGRGVGMEILLGLGAVQVVGFDLDPRMVALAQTRLAKYGDRAPVFVGDAAHMSLPDTSFDVVVEYAIIHHIPAWPQALREIARILKPDGIFYFEDLLKGLIASPLMRALFDHPQATQFTALEFRTALEAAGLAIKQWQEIGTWGFTGQATK